MEILHHQRFVLPAGHILADSYDVVWCGACGFAYADTAADQATYDRYYAAFSKYEDNKTSAGGGGSDWDSRRLRETADDIAGVVSNREARVVDIGCANGGLLAELRSCGFGNLLGIACPMCFIPKLSYDYRLLMLIAPLCLFISQSHPIRYSHAEI